MLFKKKGPLLEQDEIDIDSTWGGRVTERMVSPRILRKYCELLKKINAFLFLISILLMIAIVVCVVKLVFFTTYEITIFEDGTDLYCIHNPKTGEFRQNAK